MFSVIIVSAGRSLRYQKSIINNKSLTDSLTGNKTLELIGGIPVFLHSLLAFHDICYQEVILTVSPEDYKNNTYPQYLKQYKKFFPESLASRLQIISGGAERYQSVKEGLLHCSSDSKWVLIHDAARPLIHETDLKRIQDTIQNHLEEEVGILPVTNPTDTIKQVDERGWVTRNLPRTTLKGASTPQCFPLFHLRKTYQKWEGNSYEKVPTDDSEIYFEAGYPVITITLQYPNPKLTTVDDYDYLSRLWKRRLLNKK